MGGQLTYAVDIVFCIDTTGSMGELIAQVKGHATAFEQELKKVMDAKGKTIDALRVRVVPYRDFYADGGAGWNPSQFFTLPKDNDSFRACVNSLAADGGGDEPECGLEALVAAIRSDWTKTGDKRRQVIVLYTDASSHPLEKAAASKPTGYPDDMPANFNDLTDLWEGQTVNRSGKRLIMFAPDAKPWSDIANHWTNVVHHTSKAGKGLVDVDYNAILDVIANSV